MKWVGSIAVRCKILIDDLKMKEFTQKMKFFLPRYLFVGVSSVILFALFRWIFSIQLMLLDFTNEAWSLYLPFTITWIPILLYITPCLTAFRIKSQSVFTSVGSSYLESSLLISVFCGLAIIFSITFSQIYITDFMNDFKGVQHKQSYVLIFPLFILIELAPFLILNSASFNNIHSKVVRKKYNQSIRKILTFGLYNK
jgi:hypothetical protein